MTTKDARININNGEFETEITLASNLKGVSLTDFVIDVVEIEVRQTIQDYKVLKLSERDSKAFLDALEDPPEPDKHLKEAARTYKALMEE